MSDIESQLYFFRPRTHSYGDVGVPIWVDGYGPNKPKSVDASQTVAEAKKSPPHLTGGQLLQDSLAEGVQLRLDWLELTFHKSSDDKDRRSDALMETVRALASEAMGVDEADWLELDYGGMGYGRGAVGPGGARLWWQAPHRDDVHVRLPGKACASMGGEKAQGFIREAIRRKAVATRIDLALDDFDRSVGVLEVLQAVDSPSAVTRTRDWILIAKGRVGSRSLLDTRSEGFLRGWQDTVLGATLYVGSPQSRQRLRVYDKNLESHGQVNSIRWEYQAREEAAETLLTQLSQSGGSWGNVAKGRFVGFLDFREQDDTNVTRRTRTVWYERLMGKVERIKAFLPKPARTFDEMLEWFMKTQAQGLAVIKAVGGDDLVRLVTDYGKKRWRPKHRALAHPS